MKDRNDDESDISKLLNVMGYIAVKELESIPEKVKVLSSLGFSNKQMALICNTSDGTIRVQKTLNKKKK